MSESIDEIEINLPKYGNYRELWALKIQEVEVVPEMDEGVGGARLYFEEKGYIPIDVDRFFLAENQPNPGMYFIINSEGDRYCMEAEEFENNFKQIEEES